MRIKKEMPTYGMVDKSSESQKTKEENDFELGSKASVDAVKWIRCIVSRLCGSG